MPVFKSKGIGRFCNVPFYPEKPNSLVGEAAIHDKWKIEQIRKHSFYGTVLFEVGVHEKLPVNDPDSNFEGKNSNKSNDNPYDDYRWLKARAIELELELPGNAKKEVLQAEIRKAEKALGEQ